MHDVYVTYDTTTFKWDSLRSQPYPKKGFYMVYPFEVKLKGMDTNLHYALCF